MIRSLRSRIAFTLSLALGATLAAPSAWATDYTLDPATCVTTYGGTWTLQFSFCTVTNFSLLAGDKLTIPALTNLSLDGACVNRGELEVSVDGSLSLGSGDTLDNRGSVVNAGTFSNYGNVNNLLAGSLTNVGTVSDSAYLLNEGEIRNLDDGTLIVNSRSVIDNYGLITNEAGTALIKNHTLAFLKNRGGALLEIRAGELQNEDQGTVTSVNGSSIQIMDGATFVNGGLSSLVLVRANGELINEGTFTNVSGAIIENHGNFENHSLLVSTATARVVNESGAIFWNTGSFENRDSSAFENWGLVSTQQGSLDNFCDATLMNELGGQFLGAFDNWDGLAINNGFWLPGPTNHNCVHRI